MRVKMTRKTNNRSKKILFQDVLKTVPFLVCVAVLSAGCSGPVKKDLKEEYPVSREYARGPITASLKLSSKELTIADKLTLLLEVKLDKDYEAELPDPGGTLGEFKVGDYHDAPSRLIDSGQVLLSRTVELEPFLSGDYRIPPLKILFWQQKEGRDKAHELETEELTVKVNSILPENLKDLTVMDIAGPVPLPPPDPTVPLIIGIAAFLALGGGTALFLYLKYFRKRREQISTVPAHELAYGRLAALVEQDLIGKGEVKLFHFVISDILRRYIEDRFRLHAPEQTTEEFLADLKDRDLFDGNQKTLLKEFLSHCDLVKFAEHAPQAAEIQRTFDTCRDFIQATEDRESLVVQPAAERSPA
jgi:hypothetical protein